MGVEPPLLNIIVCCAYLFISPSSNNGLFFYCFSLSLFLSWWGQRFSVLIPKQESLHPHVNTNRMLLISESVHFVVFEYYLR